MTFGFEVSKHVLQEGLIEQKNNLVCSPISIDALLQMVASGSKGKSLEQLLVLLGCVSIEGLHVEASRLAGVLKGSNRVDAPEVSFVNALWFDQQCTLDVRYREVLKKVYNAKAWPFDFQNQAGQVVKEANLWAEKETKGLIKKFIDSLNPETRVLLANAIYFKGAWYDPFEPLNTKESDFFLLNGDKVSVFYLNKEHTEFEYGTFGACKVLRMRYTVGDSLESKNYEYDSRTFSMYFFLPKAKDGLPSLLENLKMDASFFDKQIKLKYEDIRLLSIPKFKFECDMKLSGHMQQLGLTLPFDGNCKDFTGIIPPDDEQFYVSGIAQKSFVEIDEQGTKAAAVTYEIMEGGIDFSEPQISHDFVADHPFMFMIREDVSNSVLFVGTVINPLLMN